MSKRQLILGAVLGVLAIVPMVDNASADQRIWRRQILPSYLDGDPEWPEGIVPSTPGHELAKSVDQSRQVVADDHAKSMRTPWWAALRLWLWRVLWSA